MNIKRHDPSLVHTTLVFICLFIDVIVLITSGVTVDVGARTSIDDPNTKPPVPLLIWSSVAGLYFVTFLIVQFIRPNSPLVYTGTDIIMLTILFGTGLGAVITASAFGLNKILTYANKPLVASGVIGYLAVFFILATLLYEALYVYIHYGGKWNHSLSSLAANPAMRVTRDSDSDIESRSAMVTAHEAQPAALPLLPPIAAPLRETTPPIAVPLQETTPAIAVPSQETTPADEDTEVLPDYEMIGSSNAAAYYGAEAPVASWSTFTPGTTNEPNIPPTVPSRSGKHIFISPQERRLKQEVLEGLNRARESYERLGRSPGHY